MMRIAEAREARGWTQEQLAAAIGTTQQTIQRWESGHTEPKVSNVEKISSALGITLSFILDIDNDKDSETLSNDERELLACYRSLSTKGKHAVLVGLRDFVNGQ